MLLLLISYVPTFLTVKTLLISVTKKIWRRIWQDQILQNINDDKKNSYFISFMYKSINNQVIDHYHSCQINVTNLSIY